MGPRQPQGKRHIPVRFKKATRRKRRKPSGTVSTNFQRAEQSTLYPTSCGQPIGPPHPATNLQTPSQRPKPLITNAEVPGVEPGDESDSSGDNDIHELGWSEEDKGIVLDEGSLEMVEEDGGGGTGQQELRRNEGAYVKVEKVMMGKHVLTALCQVIGSSRLTAKQYKLSRSLINYEAGYEKPHAYPSFSTISASILPVMRKFVYVPTVLRTITVDSRRSGAPQPSSTPTGELLPVTRRVKLVFPSSWARKDVRTIPHFTSRAADLLHDPRTFPTIAHATIESSPVVQDRPVLFRSNILQSVSRNGTVWISDSNVHDITDIEVIIHRPPQHATSLLATFCADPWIEDRQHVFALKGKVIATNLQENPDNSLIAGDIVSVLRIPNCPPHLSVLLVHRMKRTPRHPPQAIIIRTTQGTTREHVIRCKRISAISSERTEVHRPMPLSHVQTYGRLADGRFYAVYRVILYSDDFEQFVRKKGSAGGCYLLPVNLPLDERVGVGAVRVIALTPPGISTNKAILNIILDIFAGATTGFQTVDYFGVRSSVFIEVIAYIGDYVAVQHVQDLNGPRGNAPCSLCTFPKGSTIGATTSNYAYSVTTHSGHASFRRDKRRMRALRRYCTSDEELQEIGLQGITGDQESQLPLHALSDALDRVREDIPKTEHGHPVVSAFFDPYLSALVAPDHLFGGLGEDVINANMRLLSKQQRVIAESLIQHALSRNALGTEPHLYNHDKLHLHSMSISTMFNLILVAPWAIYLSRAYTSDGHRNTSANTTINPCVDLLFMYQKLVADTLYFPTCDFDGKDTVVRYNESRSQVRLKKLKAQCASYIEAVDSVCAGNALAKKELDKPNIHRLLELYNHTIPLLGHVRQGQELLFEAAHQHLKRGLKNSNYRDAQLTAMDEMLAKDWKARLAAPLHAYNVSSNSDLSDALCSKLKEVLCGDASSNNGEDIRNTSGSIKACFKPPVIHHLLSFTYGKSQNRTAHRKWVPIFGKKDDIEHVSLVADTTQAIKYASSLYKQHTDAREVQRVMYARNVHKQTSISSASSGKTPKSSVHVLNRSDVIQAVVRVVSNNLSEDTEPVRMLYLQEDCTDCSAVPSCEKRFWLVLDIVSVRPPSTGTAESEEDNIVFAIVWPISYRTGLSSPISKHRHLFSVTEKSKTYILPLKRSVVKVLSLHLCNWDTGTTCRVVPRTEACEHSGSIVDGEPFLLFGSAEGYPPRVG